MLFVDNRKFLAALRQPLGAILRHENRVLDAQAAPARDIDTRLIGYEHTRLENRIAVPALGKAWHSLMDFKAKAMSQTMPKILVEIVAVQVLARTGVNLLARLTRRDVGQDLFLRLEYGGINLALAIRRLAEENIDQEQPGDWNQALMDIGAGICVPGTPDCAACPLAEKCNARQEDDADLLPVRAAAKPPVPVAVGVGLVTCGSRILMQRA